MRNSSTEGSHLSRPFGLESRRGPSELQEGAGHEAQWGGYQGTALPSTLPCCSPASAARASLHSASAMAAAFSGASWGNSFKAHDWAPRLASDISKMPTLGMPVGTGLEAKLEFKRLECMCMFASNQHPGPPGSLQAAGNSGDTTGTAGLLEEIQSGPK